MKEARMENGKKDEKIKVRRKQEKEKREGRKEGKMEGRKRGQKERKNGNKEITWEGSKKRNGGTEGWKMEGKKGGSEA